jgi:UPF0755 protein
LDQNQSFIAEFFELTKEDEGYLFPDTYSIANNATPGAIVTKMKSNFSSRVDALVPQGSDLTKSQFIVLASLIERETKTGDERSIVAGILLNRLNAGWPLQVDATVQYAPSARCKSTTLNCSVVAGVASDLGSIHR